MGKSKSYPWVDAGAGVRRRVLAETHQAMTVRVEFRKGALGELHRHEHVQTIFVASGEFEFTVDGIVRRYGAGDSLVVPSNALHGCVALDDGTLIDSFMPRRDDFL